MQINQKSANEDFLIEGCRKLANELVQYYTKIYSDFPPFYPDRIAKELNIEVEEKNITRSGYVSTYKEKQFIVLNAEEYSYRKRFTCAHELAHILFYKKSLTTEIINLEQLCDIFASNFLLPAEYFGKVSQNIEDNFSFETLEKIKKDFKVNLKPLIYRIGQLKLIKNSNHFILVIEDKLNKYTKCDKKLRVSRCILPGESNFYIPENIGAGTLGLSVEKLIELNVLESTPIITESVISSVKDTHTSKYKKQTIICNARYKSYGYENHEYIIGLFDTINIV